MNHPDGLTHEEWVEFIDLVEIADNIIGDDLNTLLFRKIFSSVDGSVYGRNENWICLRLVELNRKRSKTFNELIK